MRLVLLMVVYSFLTVSMASAQELIPPDQFFAGERILRMPPPLYSELTPELKEMMDTRIKSQPDSVAEFWNWFEKNQASLYATKSNDDPIIKTLKSKIESISPEIKVTLGWSGAKIVEGPNDSAMGGMLVESKQSIRTLEVTTTHCSEKLCRLAQTMVVSARLAGKKKRTCDLQVVQLGESWLVELGPHAHEVDAKRLITPFYPIAFCGLSMPRDMNQKEEKLDSSKPAEILYSLSKRPDHRINLTVYSDRYFTTTTLLAQITRCLGVDSTRRVLGKVDFDSFANAPQNSFGALKLYSEFEKQRDDSLRKTDTVQISSQDLSPFYPCWRELCPFALDSVYSQIPTVR